MRRRTIVVSKVLPSGRWSRTCTGVPAGPVRRSITSSLRIPATGTSSTSRTTSPARRPASRAGESGIGEVIVKRPSTVLTSAPMPAYSPRIERVKASSSAGATKDVNGSPSAET